eukprot:Gb_23016 [translate_table: standard]
MIREDIMQHLFPGCEESEAWNKSNGFIINRITHEGAKWAAQFLTRRLVGTAASTYLSHQWVVVAAKLARGKNFPMLSLLAVICMVAMSPPQWITPYEIPRLNAYTFLHKRKGVEKDRRANPYLGKFYLTLQQINDGLKATRRSPEYVKKQWKEALWIEEDQKTYISYATANVNGVRKEVPIWPNPAWIDTTLHQMIAKFSDGFQWRCERQLNVEYPFFSPKAQHHYWSVNKENFREQPFIMAWLPMDLPIIPLPVVRREKEALGKDKKKKSTPVDPVAQKRKHLEEDPNQGTSTPLSVNPINIASPLTSLPPIAQVPLFIWSHDVAATDPNLDAAFDINPPPSLQRVRAKRKEQFTPKELELELVQQAHHTCEENEALNLNLNLLTKETSGLGTLLETEQGTLAQDTPPSVRPYVHLLRQTILKTKEAPLIPPEIQDKISQLELEVTRFQEQVDNLQERLTTSLEVFLGMKEMHFTHLSRLAEMNAQLASKKASLENKYSELQEVRSQEQQTEKEVVISQLRGELTSMRHRFLSKRESYFGEIQESEHWKDRARILASRATTILKDTLPLTGLTQSDVQELIPSICSLRILAQEMNQVNLKGKHILTEYPSPSQQPAPLVSSGRGIQNSQEDAARETPETQNRVPLSTQVQPLVVDVETEEQTVVDSIAPARNESVLDLSAREIGVQPLRSPTQQVESIRAPEVLVSQSAPEEETPPKDVVCAQDPSDLVHEASPTIPLNAPLGFSIPLAVS